MIDNLNQPETSLNTVVEGNYVGLAVDGITPLGGHGNGALRIINGANGNSIGGSASGAGNVISGSNGAAISISTKNNLVQGNFIGTDKTGMIAKPNASGISISSANASNNSIGGTTAAARNVISGNTGGAVGLTSGTSANFLYNNFIGVAVDGTTALGNGSGVSLVTTNGNFIGNSTSTGNVISANGQRGISFVDADNNFVQGNLIGTNAAGTADLGNGDDGIEFLPLLQLSTGNTIGGANANQRNVISGNNQSGINLDTGAQNTVVQNNFIGTGANGTTPIGNTGAGIVIFLSSNNTIGGTGAGNTVAFNAIGISVPNNQSLIGGTGNRISANFIFSNTGLGIDLGNNGVTPNDTGDGDLRANNQQNFPVLSSANATTVTGTLNSTANTQFTLEFFLSPTADATNFGEGQTFLGSLVVTTNGSGDANFNFTSPIALPNAQFIAATAIKNSNGDTSEFSQVRQILAPTAASVNIQGRVLTPEGRPISKAMLTLVEPNGNVRYAMTNPFGYYHFLEVPSGETYILNVSHKTYDFNPSSFVINLTEEITDLVIIGTRRETLDENNLDEKIPVIETPNESPTDARKPKP